MTGQPDLATPLACGLTAEEIIDAVMRDCNDWGATYTTSIDPNTFDIVNTVANDRTGFSVQVGCREVTMTDNDTGDEETTVTYLCELKINNVFVFGLWELNFTLSGHSEMEWAERAAEESFMRAATLIGKRTERQVVVVE
jgi:hypothetical protein